MSRRALLDTIFQRPDDDELRLVYADALEEEGDAAHAELIRRQIAGDVERAQQIEKEHAARIAGVAAEHVKFDRGLVSELHDIPPCALAENADAILGGGPIHTIVLGDADDDEWEGDWEEWPGHTLAAAKKLAACPHLAPLRILDMSGGALGDSNDEGERLKALLESPYLTKLETLVIGSECSTAATVAIAEAHERLPALRVLRIGAPLGNGRVKDEGAQALAASPLCSRLEILEILGSDITNDGFEPLARAFRALRELWLGGTWYVQNPIGSEGARALAKASVPGLVALDLGGAGIGDDGVRALATAPWFANLRYLDLGDNDLTDGGLREIAKGRSLEELVLAFGSVHPEHPHTLSDPAIDALFVSCPNLEFIRTGPDGGTARRP